MNLSIHRLALPHPCRWSGKNKFKGHRHRRRIVRNPERQRRIPTLITDLASPDATTRSLAYFHLRLWTGQSFGHAWKGHQSMRPTQKEGREMQPDWTNWWATSDASSR